MVETEHLADMVAYVMGEDESELGKTKAELAYALHCLEREIAICADLRRLLWMVVKANDGFELEYHDVQDYPGDDRARLAQSVDPATRSLTLRASDVGQPR
jgi:hypothetical protein